MSNSTLSNIANTIIEPVPTETREFAEKSSLNSLWVIIGTVLVFWMHAGFCLLEAGSIRSKNVINILFKNMLNVLMTTLLWWFFGYSFAFGKSNTNGFIGGSEANTYTTVEIWDDSDALNFWLFQWAFAATALTIVSGGMAERANTVCRLL